MRSTAADGHLDLSEEETSIGIGDPQQVIEQHRVQFISVTKSVPYLVRCCYLKHSFIVLGFLPTGVSSGIALHPDFCAVIL